MADIKLGPSGSETTLPVINWRGSGPPSLPVFPFKRLQEDVMMDGSRKYSSFNTKREWTLEWGNLTKANLDVLEGLYDLTQVLRFQNNWEDATWYNVVVFSLSFNPIVITYAIGTTTYRVRMVIKET